SCVPTTCEAQHASCGIIPDGCDGTLDCGPCAAAPTITGMHVIGAPEKFFDHTQAPPGTTNFGDGAVSAYREQSGKVNLVIPAERNYRLRGQDLLNVTLENNAPFFDSFIQANDMVEDHYNFRIWFASAYSVDGMNFYAYNHSEWYAAELDGYD